MTADVNQRVGSVTKAFTGTVLLQLTEQGNLSLDDPIEKYLPGTRNGTATLAQLAEMRSGIPSYTFDEQFQDALFSDPERSWRPAELVELVADDESMFEPGSMMFYSNTNTVLLGMVIEKVTGKSVNEVMKKQIFEPLGMTHSEFPPMRPTRSPIHTATRCRAPMAKNRSMPPTGTAHGGSRWAR